MLKQLAFVAALTFAVPTMAIQHEPSSTQAAKQGESDTKGPNPPARSIANNQATNYYEQPSEPKPHGWHKLVTWPEGVTAWLVMLTLGAIVWQSYETRKSAQAAQKSAGISASAERAWLITTQVQFAPLLPETVTSEVVIHFHNAGRSPAEIESAHCISFIFPRDYDFPHEPMYDGIEDLMKVTAIPGEIIPPDEKRLVLSHIRHSRLMSQTEIEEVLTGRKILYCYGRVEYKDISGVKRTTQFGYYYVPKSEDGPGMLPAMYRINSRAYNFTT